MSADKASLKVIKSPNDKRDYRVVVLPNQLEVLLVSDLSSDQAAVSLDIQAGQMHDPINRQGLAHFLEHMLFLGNQKYPEPEGFGKYLSSYGGHSNAYTAFEDTNYFFAIQNDHLEGALDRFSQFFISPLFNFKFVEREINAVNSEHNKNIKDDRRRIFRVLKSISNPNHPYHQFGTGNITTLKGDDKDHLALQKELIAFFENHYSANLMKLVIVGKEPLTELERLAVKYFSPIKNKELKPKSYSELPIISDKLPRKVLIEPVKSIRQLRMSFPTPSYQKHFRNKPGSVVSQLLGDEGEGSVLAYLKDQGWVSSLSAGTGFGTRDFSFYGLEMTLTPEGLEHVEDIVQTVFQYIEIIKETKNLNGYYEELKAMADVGFKFREKENPVDYARYLAANMQNVPGNEALVSRWLYEEFRPDLTRNLLEYLTADNLQLVLVAPGVEVNRTEQWYQAKYDIKDIAASVIESWRSPGTNPKLSLPNSNPFLPKNIALNPIVVKDEHPVILKDTEKIRIWYKQDTKFRIPKGNLQIQMSSKQAYLSVENAAMTKLFSQLLKEHLNEYAYPASLAGLNYHFTNSVSGLVFNINGYSENIWLLFEKIVSSVNNLEIDEKRFKILKEQMRERRQNQKLSQAFQRITYESYYLLSETLWHTDDYLSVIDQVTVEKLNRFIPVLLKELKIEVYGHGNFKVEELKKIGEKLETLFTQTGAPPAEEITERTLIVPESPDYVYQFAVEDINSAIEIHYQLGPTDLKQAVMLDMIQQIIEKPFYHQLRTVEQLGYLVWSGYRPINKVDGFYFIIQSGVKDPVYLQERIDSFVGGFYPQLKDISDQDFNKFRSALIAKRLEPPKNMGEETFRYWNEISSKSYQFDRREREIALLKKLKKSEIVNLYKERFIENGSARKISLQAFGKNHPLRKVSTDRIKDIKTFKDQMDFYPAVRGDLDAKVYFN